MYLELREQKCFTKTAIKDVTEPIFPPCDLKNEQITNVQAIVQLLPISLYTLPGEKSLQTSNIGYENVTHKICFDKQMQIHEPALM